MTSRSASLMLMSTTPSKLSRSMCSVLDICDDSSDKQPPGLLPRERDLDRRKRLPSLLWDNIDIFLTSLRLPTLLWDAIDIFLTSLRLPTLATRASTPATPPTPDSLDWDRDS